HPAKTLNIKGIFERIAIDLVFGLPLTEEGFLGVMVISEYLNKYPYLHPKYRGPFTVIGLTKNDNYIVEDALKNIPFHGSD
ncbi:hypothetical protein BpHYR1_031568, partial [Brachionus plicatilis]